MCLITARTGLIAVVWPGARFTYAGGALHSTNDEPALVVRRGTGDRVAQKVRGLPLVGVKSRPDSKKGGDREYAAEWTKCSFGDNVGGREERWYDRGDLHRDFGPAATGHNTSEIIMFWCKYTRGELGNPFNTYAGDHSGVETYASDDIGPFECVCAPGASIAACCFYVGKKLPLDYWGAVVITFAIYQTDNVRVIKFLNPVVTAKCGHIVGAADAAVLGREIGFRCACDAE